MKFHFLNFVSRGRPFNAIKGFTYIACIIAMCCVFPVQAQMPVANDIIAFSGGAESPDNPDVYVIDMGDYVSDKEYTITFNRPQGAVADYPVSVPLILLNNEWFSIDIEGYGSYDIVLGLAGGEISKTITITAPSRNLRGSKGYLYLFFGEGNRSKAQYPVLKLVWTNTETPTATTFDPEYPRLDFLPEHVGGVIGNYGVFSFDYSYSADLTVKDDTKLKLSRKSIDHATQPITVDDKTTATDQIRLLSPEEAVGEQTPWLTFLYKLSEDAVLSNYPEDLSEGFDQLVNPAVLYQQVDSIFGLHYADGSNDKNEPCSDYSLPFRHVYAANPNNELRMREDMDLPPRFGTITTDKSSYNIRETVTLTIPVLNWRLLRKIFGTEWIDNKIDITLDGGQTFINHGAFSFDETTGNLTVFLKAANDSGNAITMTAEMAYTRKNFYMDSGEKVWRYPYGAFASYTVTTETAPFKPITSLGISLPTDSIVILDLYKNYSESEHYECVGEGWDRECQPIAIEHWCPKVNTDASFFGGTWTSSDPTIATIDANGTFIARKHGKVTITFTSDEVAYRTANGLPPNEELYTRSFDIYVVAPMPDVWIQNGQNYVYLPFNGRSITLENNLKDSPWEINGEVKTELIHSDSATYHSIESALEITYNHKLYFPLFFDAKTFPQITTLVPDSTSSIWSGVVKKVASPYIVKISVPLKQEVGDKVITTVYNNSFPIHVYVPKAPEVTLLQEKKPDGIRCLSGDSIVLKYEIKYLSKKFHAQKGFLLEYGMSYKEGDWNSSHNLPFYTITENDLNNLPEGLTITDKGYWYDAELTFKYALPAPNGENKIPGMESGAELFIYKFRAYEPHYSGSRYYAESRQFWTYTGDPDEPEKQVQYYRDSDKSQTLRQLGEWEEFGLENDKILALINEANTTSHNYDALDSYLESHGNIRRLLQNETMDQAWQSADLKLVRTGSDDAIFHTLNSKNSAVITVPCNKTDDYSLTLSYKKYGWERSYPIHVDSIGNYYPMTFRLAPTSKLKMEFDTTIPLSLSYMTADSIQVDTTVTIGTRGGKLAYILHEPRGVIGNVNYVQFNQEQELKGSAPLRSLTGFMLNSHYIGSASTYTKESYDNNNCEYVENHLRIRVVDMKTGKLIPADKNLHINCCPYINQSGNDKRKHLMPRHLITDQFTILEDNVISGTFYPPSLTTEIPGQNKGYIRGLLLEVVADGYIPALILADGTTENGTVVSLRPISSQTKYTKTLISTSRDEYSYSDRTNDGLQSIYSILKPTSVIMKVTLPLQPGWIPNNLKLKNGRSSEQISPLPIGNGFGADGQLLNYSDSRSTLYDLSQFGFKNDYIILKYNNISFDNNQSFFAPQTTYYPLIFDSGTRDIISQIPYVRNNNELNKVDLAESITEDVKSKILDEFSPGKFNKSNYGDMGNLNKAFDGIDGLNFDLPDPLPFSIETRYEGNRFYIMGIASHNFINNLPIVGQINMAGGYVSRVNEMATAFQSMKSAVKKARGQTNSSKMRNFTPSVNIFGGIKGYIEGYAEYDPVNHKVSWGLNEAGLYAELSGGASAWINGGFVNVKTQISGLASFGIGISQPSFEDMSRPSDWPRWTRNDLWLESKLSLDVYAEASGGIDLYIASAKVGVYAGGGFENRNKVILRPYLRTNDKRFVQSGGFLNINAYMYAFAKAHFLFWSWKKEWKIFETNKTWFYPNDNNNPYKSPTLRSLSSVYQRSTATLPGGIISDVASNAGPMWLSDGNSLLFNNLKNPEEENDDRLMIYGNNSQADMIADASLPAFGFDLAHSATNKVSVVAYEQMADSIRPILENVSEETHIKTQAGNSDIYAAVKNGAGNWVTTQISDVDDEVETEPTDMQPKTAVSADGQTAVVVWRSGNTKFDDSGAKVYGNLYFSRYKDAVWQKPVYLTNADFIGDYVPAIDGDSIVIATTRLEQVIDPNNPQQMDAISRIRLISVSKDNDITSNETGMIGRHPQIKPVADNYYVSFAGEKQISDTVSVSDIYLMPISRNGQALISQPFGFAGMENKVAFGFKLASEPNASSISDLAIVYNAAQIEGEGVMTHNLVASKFGVENGTIYASSPTTLLSVEADSTQMITDYDIFKTDDTLKAAATVSNINFGAVVVEGSATFENKIACISEEYNSSDVKAGQELEISFYVQNKGVQPLTSLKVTIDGKPTTTASTLLPNSEMVVSGIYTLPIGATDTDSVSYSILGTFADNTSHSVSGKMDFTQYQINVDLVSLYNGEENNTVIVDVTNNSESPLTSKHQVTVGVYEDLLGKTLAAGTKLEIYSASDFYSDNGSGDLENKQKTVAFQVPNVTEATTYYVIAKVRKSVSQKAGLRASGENEDVEQSNRMYVPIQLYPIGDDGPITDNPQIVIEDNILIYAVPGNVKIEMKSLGEGETQVLNIYDISGKLIHHSEITDPETYIPLRQGVYLVSVGLKTEKVIVTQNASNR